MSLATVIGARGRVVGVGPEGLIGSFSHPEGLTGVPLPSAHQFSTRQYPNEGSRIRITGIRLETGARVGDLVVAQLCVEEEETGRMIPNPNRASRHAPWEIPELRIVGAHALKWGVFSAPQSS